MLIIFLLLCSLAIQNCDASECDCSEEVFGSNYTSLQLNSPNFPHGCPNLNCTYIIEADAEQAVQFSFEYLQIGGAGAYLDIYQTFDRNGTIIKMYQGRYRTIGPNHADYSSNGLAYPSFHAAVGVGFEIRYQTEESYQVESHFKLTFTRTTYSPCSHPLLVASSSARARIPTSEQWPKSGCVFHIEVPSARVMHVVPKGDNSLIGLEVHQSSSILLWDYQTSPRYKSSQSENIWIRALKTDYYSTGSRRSYQRHEHYNSINWPPVVEYYSLDFEPCECNSSSYHLSGNDSMAVSSPGYPNTYCKKLECSFNFTLEAPSSDEFHAVFIFTFDYLGHDSDDLTVTLDGSKQSIQYTGGTVINRTHVFPGSKMSFTFKSATERSNHGYTFTIQRAEIPNECLCPSVLPKTLKYDSNLSMVIPANCHLMTCRYRLNFAPNRYEHFMRVKTSYQFASENEFFELISSPKTTRYFKTSDSDMTKHFVVQSLTTDILYTRLEYEDTANSMDSHFNVTWMLRGACYCDNANMTATNEWQLFVSPDYPDNYCNDMDCVSTITADPSSLIIVNITNFYTESRHDFLYIRDGIGANSTGLKTLHGRNPKRGLIRSSMNTMSFNFVSDHETTGEGYVIYYKAVRNENPPTTTQLTTTSTTSTPSSITTTMSATSLVSAISDGPSQSITKEIGTTESHTSSTGSHTIYVFIIGCLLIGSIVFGAGFILHKRGYVRIGRSRDLPAVSFRNNGGGSGSTSLHSITSSDAL